MTPLQDERYANNLETVICVPRNACPQTCLFESIFNFSTTHVSEMSSFIIDGCSGKWFSGQIMFRWDEAVKLKCTVQFIRLWGYRMNSSLPSLRFFLKGCFRYDQRGIGIWCKWFVVAVNHLLRWRFRNKRYTYLSEAETVFTKCDSFQFYKIESQWVKHLNFI